MEEKIKKRIEKLIAEINDHNYSYYVLDNPELTDSEYDSLFRKLEKLESEYPSLISCLLYTSPSPRDMWTSRMPSSA